MERDIGWDSVLNNNLDCGRLVRDDELFALRNERFFKGGGLTPLSPPKKLVSQRKKVFFTDVLN